MQLANRRNTAIGIFIIVILIVSIHFAFFTGGVMGTWVYDEPDNFNELTIRFNRNRFTVTQYYGLDINGNIAGDLPTWNIVGLDESILRRDVRNTRPGGVTYVRSEYMPDILLNGRYRIITTGRYSYRLGRIYFTFGDGTEEVVEVMRMDDELGLLTRIEGIPQLTRFTRR